MKIFKIAQQQYEIERYIPKDKLDEYRALKAKLNEVSSRFVHLNKTDENYDKKSADTLEELQDVDKKVVEYEKIPKEKIAQERSQWREQENKKKLQTEKRFKEIHKIGTELENYARKHFGLTDDIYLAGYMFTDGDLLLMSYNGTQRDMDHRYIREAFPSKTPIDDGSNGMRQFMKATGAIRVNAFRDSDNFSFDLPKTPSTAQMRMIMQCLKKKKVEISMNGDANEFTHGDEKQMVEFVGYKGYLWF